MKGFRGMDRILTKVSEGFTSLKEKYLPEKKVEKKKSRPVDIEDLDEANLKKLLRTLLIKLKFHRTNLGKLQSEGADMQKKLRDERTDWDDYYLKPLSAMVSQILTLSSGKLMKQMEVEREHIRLYALAVDMISKIAGQSPPKRSGQISEAAQSQSNTPGDVTPGTPGGSATPPPRGSVAGSITERMSGSDIDSATPDGGGNLVIPPDIKDGSISSATASGATTPGGIRKPRVGLRVMMEGPTVQIYFTRKVLNGLRRRMPQIRRMEIHLDELNEKYKKMRKELEPVPSLPTRRKKLRELIAPALADARKNTKPNALYWYHPFAKLTSYMRSLLLDIRKPEGACAKKWINLMNAEKGWALRGMTQNGGGGDLRVAAIAGFYSQLAQQLRKRYQLSREEESVLRVGLERVLHPQIKNAVEARVPVGPKRAADIFKRRSGEILKRGPEVLGIVDSLQENPEGYQNIGRFDPYHRAVEALGKLSRVGGIPWDMMHATASAVAEITSAARRNLLLNYKLHCSKIYDVLPGSFREVAGRHIIEFLGAKIFRRKRKDIETGVEMAKDIVGGPAEHVEPNADQLFPLIVWVVANSSGVAQRLPENLWLIRTALPPAETEYGESGMSLSLLEAAVNHITGDLSSPRATTPRNFLNPHGSSSTFDQKNNLKRPIKIDKFSGENVELKNSVPVDATTDEPAIDIQNAARAASAEARRIARNSMGKREERQRLVELKVLEDERKMSMENALKEFYKKHAPEKCKGIKKIVEFYWNKPLESLNSRLRKTYDDFIVLSPSSPRVSSPKPKPPPPSSPPPPDTEK
mmetsp:Transcript_14057/g.21304  ORF Transcript_14057/g.21304 Transcript_14057/m.21304 type:complete len:811 (-) Transcript_14057:80-2512(-)